MRYTEYDYKTETPFDTIRLMSSSIFLAPFRLVNEISKKILYLPKDLVEKVEMTAMGINVGAMVIDIGFDLVNNQSPVPACIYFGASLGLLVGVYLFTKATMKEVKFIQADKADVEIKKKARRHIVLEKENIVTDDLDMPDLSLTEEDKPKIKEEIVKDSITVPNLIKERVPEVLEEEEIVNPISIKKVSDDVLSQQMKELASRHSKMEIEERDTVPELRSETIQEHYGMTKEEQDLMNNIEPIDEGFAEEEEMEEPEDEIMLDEDDDLFDL